MKWFDFRLESKVREVPLKSRYFLGFSARNLSPTAAAQNAQMHEDWNPTMVYDKL